MTGMLAEIREEISKLEERLALLRAAEEALIALESPPKWPEAASYVKSEMPAKGLAVAIRGLLTETGPMTHEAILTALGSSRTIGKGALSGALQAMKVRGIITRTKAGKWRMK